MLATLGVVVLATVDRVLLLGPEDGAGYVGPVSIELDVVVR